jgi:hypothetical protein
MQEMSQTLKADNQLFRDVFNASPIGIAVENLEGPPASSGSGPHSQSGSGKAVHHSDARGLATHQRSALAGDATLHSAEADQAILLHKLKLALPSQPPPRIKTRVLEFAPEALRL